MYSPSINTKFNEVTSSTLEPTKISNSKLEEPIFRDAISSTGAPVKQSTSKKHCKTQIPNCNVSDSTGNIEKKADKTRKTFIESLLKQYFNTNEEYVKLRGAIQQLNKQESDDTVTAIKNIYGYRELSNQDFLKKIHDEPDHCAIRVVNKKEFKSLTDLLKLLGFMFVNEYDIAPIIDAVAARPKNSNGNNCAVFVTLIKEDAINDALRKIRDDDSLTHREKNQFTRLIENRVKANFLKNLDPITKILTESLAQNKDTIDLMNQAAKIFNWKPKHLITDDEVTLKNSTIYRAQKVSKDVLARVKPQINYPKIKAKIGAALFEMLFSGNEHKLGIHPNHFAFTTVSDVEKGIKTFNNMGFKTKKDSASDSEFNIGQDSLKSKSQNECEGKKTGTADDYFFEIVKRGPALTEKGNKSLKNEELEHIKTLPIDQRYQYLRENKLAYFTYKVVTPHAAFKKENLASCSSEENILSKLLELNVIEATPILYKDFTSKQASKLFGGNAVNVTKTAPAAPQKPKVRSADHPFNKIKINKSDDLYKKEQSESISEVFRALGITMPSIKT